MPKDKKLFTIKIDYRKCDGCGVCIFECGMNLFAYDVDRDRVVLRDKQECVECFICEYRCPEGAIVLSPIAFKVAEP